MAQYTYNPSIWEVEAVKTEFEASMGSTMKYCLNTNNK